LSNYIKGGGIIKLPYKIGLISTHGTGKTALAGLLEGELKRRGLEAIALPEIAQEARKRGLPINEETRLEAQIWILHRQFAQEIDYAFPRPSGPRYQVLICDRGPDNYCYLACRFGEDSYALNMTLGHLKKFPYHRLYFLPIVENNLADNKTRSLDHSFQREIDKLIRNFLQKHRLEFIELPQPKKDDHFRNAWLKLILNQTLTDLNYPSSYFIS